MIKHIQIVWVCLTIFGGWGLRVKYEETKRKYSDPYNKIKNYQTWVVLRILNIIKILHKSKT